MKKYIAVVIILALMTALIGGCTDVPSGTASLPAGMGKLVVNVTDPPPPDMDKVIVEVENLEVHKAGGPWTTVAEDMEPFDLKLLEDRVELLATAIVDAGIYTQIRLDVESVTIWVEGEEHIAKVPSGKIKLVGSFEVVDGEETEVTLDFIGAESVIVTGKGEYIFKPVIKLLIPKSAKPGNGEEKTLSGALETSGTDALIELVSDPVYSGGKSIHMATTGTVGVGDEARIVILMPEDTALDDIDSISWWVWTVTGYPPHVDITLDVDGNTAIDPEDMLTAEFAYNNVSAPAWSPNYGTWLETFETTSGDGFGSVNANTKLWVTKMGAGTADAPWDTLANWQTGLLTNNPDSDPLAAGDIDGSAPVLYIEIEVDNWIANSGAYVDDIEIVIGGVTYTIDV